MLRLYRPLAALTVLAVAIRAVVMITYSSSVFVYYNGDALRYALISPGGGHLSLFSDYWTPAGYSLFLAAVREIWSALSFSIGLQHCLGVATGLLFYAALRRTGAPRGFALVPAAIVFFSGDQIFLEHALLTESLWAVLIAGGLYALLRGVGDDSVDWRWLAVGGLALGYSSLVRPVGVVLLVVAPVWVALALRVGLARCARAAAAVVLPAAILIGAYTGIAALDHGTSGLGELGGIQLYGRVAQFADCTKFKPPGRTRLLCQTTPSTQRPGPIGQLFASNAQVLEKEFHLELPRDSALLGRFGQQAILHQPGAYASALIEDYRRIVGLGHGRLGNGANPWEMRFDLPYAYGNPAGATTPDQIARLYRADYTSVRAHPLSGWGRVLGTYQGLVRLHEGLVIVLLALASVGVGLGTARARAGAGLFLGSALCLYLVPPLIAQWDVRYGVLPGELLAVAATVGAWAVWERRRAIRLGLGRAWSTSRRRRDAGAREADYLPGRAAFRSPPDSPAWQRDIGDDVRMSVGRRTTEHFSQANPKGPGQDDVPALLRRVADSLSDLGEIEVHDLVLHTEITADGPWYSLTVYFERRTDAHD